MPTQPVNVLDRFHPAVRDWFSTAFAQPTRAQALAWSQILDGRSTLVLAPTGSGKTLAAFLTAIEKVMFQPAVSPAACRVLYVSPLKALAVDIERNLRAPLEGISSLAASRGERFRQPKVAIRTGDTPQEERSRMARRPPDILITTPESLFLLLTSQARSILASIETVILDEIHSLVGNKRGAHLSVSIERVAALSGRKLQRIGLSATQRPLDIVARFLGGGDPGPEWIPRPVSIVDAGTKKSFNLTVEVPDEDRPRPSEAADASYGTSPGFTGYSGSKGLSERDSESRFLTVQPGRPATGSLKEQKASPGFERKRSVWPSIQARLFELIRSHRSTLLFVNSRRLAERLAAALNDLAGYELARAHHGSLAREERLLIEEQLKAGKLPALVATSTLELGIDMGAIDLVVQIETPPSVAGGIQRIGRSGHHAGAVSRGILFPKFRGDLLASAAMTRAMHDGHIEAVRIPSNPLDVLAQQIVSLVVAGERHVDEVLSLVRRAAPFSHLSQSQFEGVLDMLSGRYPSERFAGFRPRLTWDRLNGLLHPREGSRALVVANPGTIPDRGLYGVFLTAEGPDSPRNRRAGGRRVGELDEEMVFESRVGEVFVLGASSWRILEITRDQVLVSPAPGEPGKIPFWKADRPPRALEFGRAVGKLTRELLAVPHSQAVDRLTRDHDLDPRAARHLLSYLEDQKRATGTVPSDRAILLERFRDEVGDWRLCLLSPFGGRVHAPWTLAIRAHLRRTIALDAEALWNDDGIVLRIPDRDLPPSASELLPAPEEIENLALGELGNSVLYAATFREAAARALLLPRRRPGQRTPLWMQRKRAADLLAAAAPYQSFPIVLEAFRECLQDIFDLPGLVDLASRIHRREIRLVTVNTQTPSPFSSSLLFDYVGNYLYDGDTPPAERRAQALSIDQRQLRELLGDGDFRELLDPFVVEELERAMQGLEEGRRVTGPDRLHDLLLRIGDLSAAEVSQRVQPRSGNVTGPGHQPWFETLIESLVKDGRACWIPIAGQQRLIAAEDLGRYRDALGVLPPPGFPEAFLEQVPHALRELLGRFARFRGPFRTEDAVWRFGIAGSHVAVELGELASSGSLMEGEFRPGSQGREWCDQEVLTTLRRRSLAHFRKQIEPASPEAFARMLLGWNGLPPSAAEATSNDRLNSLLEIIEKLQGAAITASALESEILPARIPGYFPGDLDLLTATGEVIWTGLSPLGDHDGKIALYLAEHFPLLRTTAQSVPQGALHDAIREVLKNRGASFFGEIHAAAGAGLQRLVLDAVWDLVWSGEVTNDTLTPLRALLGEKTERRRAGRESSSFRSRRPVPPTASGRWSFLPSVSDPAPPTATEKLLATAGQLLERYGILTRDAVLSEGIPGGFSALYPILSAMESQGKVRRGYFIAGLGGSQFADPAALERLRELRTPDQGDSPQAVVLAAVDPSNPYGSLLPWPRQDARLVRQPGTQVVLVEGSLVAYVSKDQRELRSFLPPEEPLRSAVGRSVAAALADWARQTRRPGLGWSPDEIVPAKESPLAPFLLEAGFQISGPGFQLDLRQ